MSEIKNYLPFFILDMLDHNKFYEASKLFKSDKISNFEPFFDNKNTVDRNIEFLRAMKVDEKIIKNKGKIF